jgi:isoquinoline 1-oxidoreductase beta subunit
MAVRQVVRIDNTVAVIGDHSWAAKQGLAVLKIVWDDGPAASMSTAGIRKKLRMLNRELVNDSVQQLYHRITG